MSHGPWATVNKGEFCDQNRSTQSLPLDYSASLLRPGFNFVWDNKILFIISHWNDRTSLVARQIPGNIMAIEVSAASP